MRNALWKYRYLVLLVMFLLVLAPTFATQNLTATTGTGTIVHDSMISFVQTPVPVTPVPVTPASGVAQQIIVNAGVIATALQGLKKLVPQINGKIAIAVNLALALTGAYAVAPTGSVLNIQFALTTLGTALGSMGIYSLLKKPQIEQNPGDGSHPANKLSGPSGGGSVGVFHS
jgi:hypothetical protein